MLHRWRRRGAASAVPATRLVVFYLCALQQSHPISSSPSLKCLGAQMSYMRISYTTAVSYMRISYTTALSYMRISYTTAGLSDLGFLGIGPGGNDLGGPGPFGCEFEISPRENVRGIPISLRLCACVEMPLGQVRVHRRKCAAARCGCNFLLKTRRYAYANTHCHRAQRRKTRPPAQLQSVFQRHLIVASIVRPSSSFIVAAPSSHNRIIP